MCQASAGPVTNGMDPEYASRAVSGLGLNYFACLSVRMLGVSTAD